jgi:hypothetical protein
VGTIRNLEKKLSFVVMQTQRPVLRRLLDRTRNMRVNVNIPRGSVREIQLRQLKKLLTKAKDTSYGKAHGFSEFLKTKELYPSFVSKVPVSEYLDMLPWWERCRNGEPHVTWPGVIEYFALSSGTSDGSSKYIPVSQDMLRSIRRASLRQVLAIARTDIPKDHIAKQWLMIGGSTSLKYNGIFYSGDLSGITTGQIPFPFQRISKPDPAIRSSKNWQEKIHKITLEAKNWDVGLIAGVPAWVQLLFENIIAHYNLNNIHDLWPNLEAYVHGGVSIKPYKQSIDALCGRPIKYFETYLASEGFIGFQSRLDSNGGMRMLIRNGIFYEFIPFNEENFTPQGDMKKHPRAIPIWEVKEGQEYALLLSTNAGAWRYLIGDTVQFTNIEKNEVIITGRTKHYISLCGEHLSVDNMNQALALTSEDLGVVFREFTMAGIPHEGLFAHQWYIACDNESVNPMQVRNLLDQHLKKLNDDYAVEREHALKDVKVELVPSSWFLEFLRSKGKEGGQNKFPRVLKNDQLSDWQAFLKRKNG